MVKQKPKNKKLSKKILGECFMTLFESDKYMIKYRMNVLYYLSTCKI